MNAQQRLYSIIINALILVHLLFLDRLPGLNEIHIELIDKYYLNTRNFIYAWAIYINLIYYGYTMILIAKMIEIKRPAMYTFYGFGIFWILFFILGIIDEPTAFNIISAIALIIAVVSILLATIGIIKSGKGQDLAILELIKFRERATRKLAKINPSDNPELYKEMLERQQKCFIYLDLLNYTDKPEERDNYERMALAEFTAQKVEIEKILRRLEMFTNLKSPEKGLNS